MDSNDSLLIKPISVTVLGSDKLIILFISSRETDLILYFLPLYSKVEGICTFPSKVASPVGKESRQSSLNIITFC